jgi:peptidyl-prolyl cis-trans isomerase A (cyclophilin A)
MAGSVSAQIYADVKTSKGDFTIQLSSETAAYAPQTAANFIRLAEGTTSWIDPITGQVKKEPYYNGVIFHRVIAGFMSQTGSRKGDGTDGPGYNFRDDFTEEMTHSEAYIVSMANSGPNTNGAQFFITASAQPSLNGVHSVFGMVILYDAPEDGTSDDEVGRKVCDAINAVATDINDKPLEDVVIQSITIRRVGAWAQSFDEHAQGLPEVSAPLEQVDYQGSQVSLVVEQPASSLTRYCHTPDLNIWEVSEEIYRDHDDSPFSSIDVSSVSLNQDKHFFNVSQVAYETGVLWPSALTGKTLTIVTKFGQTAFTYTSEDEGTLEHLNSDNSNVNGFFHSYHQGHDWLGARKYLATNLYVGDYQLHFRLRFGWDSFTSSLFQGRHSGQIIYFGSGADEEPTSGSMTLTR